MATPANSVTSGMSRLHLWMTPMPEDGAGTHQGRQRDSFSDFEVWNDDNSSVPDNPRLLQPLESDNQQQQQGSEGQEQQMQGRKEEKLQPPQLNLNPNKFTGSVVMLKEKRAFCNRIGSGECFRCQHKRKPSATIGSNAAASIVGWNTSLGWNSSRGSSSTGFSSSEQPPETFMDAVMQMKIGTWKPMPQETCSFCYIQYKRHCQRLGNPYPRPEDPGFWNGHSMKDVNGDVTCPQLGQVVCQLCFATGKNAHTLKFCPLMNV